MLQNHSLKHLLLASNGLDATACFTLSIGARENKSLKSLVLDGNPIGEQGGRIIMALVLSRGELLSVSANNCDLSIKCSHVVFNKKNPVGLYELNMDSHYGHAVAFELLDVAANHPTLIVRR